MAVLPSPWLGTFPVRQTIPQCHSLLTVMSAQTVAKVPDSLTFPGNNIYWTIGILLERISPLLLRSFKGGRSRDNHPLIRFKKPGTLPTDLWVFWTLSCRWTFSYTPSPPHTASFKASPLLVSSNVSLRSIHEPLYTVDSRLSNYPSYHKCDA